MWKVCISGLVIALMVMHGVNAEPVAPRFPDTTLLSPVLPESNILVGQGQVMVTGRLLVAPCVLTDGAVENTHTVFLSATRQLALHFEGCGDGVYRAGQSFPVRIVWSESPGKALSRRLSDGTNDLLLPAYRVDGMMELEMIYE